MNSQNGMSAAGQYIFDRVAAALQDEKGVHAESLLSCLGALAGYACQAYLLQTAALTGADRTGPALVAVTTKDGGTHLYGDALNAPLAEGPFSIWALLSATLQKLGKPLPDKEEIFRHVTEALGTSEFGVPRIPDGHHPRDLPIVYLRQIWPQILPIAQRFCSKPVQLPIVFGIALQRAVEHSKDAVDPTRAASIAMECAVAMSKVILPAAASTQANTAPAASAQAISPMASTTSASAGMGKDRAPARPRAAERGRTASHEPGRPSMTSVIADLPLGVRVVTIVLVALIVVGGWLWRAERREAWAAELAEQAQLQFNADMRALEQHARARPASREQAREQQADQEQDREEQDRQHRQLIVLDELPQADEVAYIEMTIGSQIRRIDDAATISAALDLVRNELTEWSGHRLPAIQMASSVSAAFIVQPGQRARCTLVIASDRITVSGQSAHDTAGADPALVERLRSILGITDA